MRMSVKNFKGKVKLLILSVVATLSIKFPTESDAIDVIIQVNEYQEQNPSTVVLGDLDGDGEVTPKDDLLFKEYFSGKSAEEPDCNVADVDRDGMLTRKDAMFLARYLAGWDGYLLEVVDITDKLPWEVSGSKQPKDYNWLEYQALTDAQQEAFFESFENVNDFELWMNKAQNELPWENDGKQP